MTYNLGATYILGAIYPYSELKTSRKIFFQVKNQKCPQLPETLRKVVFSGRRGGRPLIGNRENCGI
jgi:hypothetical protein